MSVSFNLDRIVLTGLPLDRRDLPRFESALRAELVAQLNSNSGPGFTTGRLVTRMRTPQLAFESRTSAATLGTRVARVLCDALRKS